MILFSKLLNLIIHIYRKINNCFENNTLINIIY